MAIYQHKTIKEKLSGSSKLSRNVSLRASDETAFTVTADQEFHVRFKFYKTDSFNTELNTVVAQNSASAGTVVDNIINMASPHAKMEVENNTTASADVSGTMQIH